MSKNNIIIYQIKKKRKEKIKKIVRKKVKKQNKL